MTARLRACGVPVRIAPSPQYLAMGVMPVRPRWGNCTPHERAMGPGNTSAALADEPRLTQKQMMFQTRASTGRHWGRAREVLCSPGLPRKG